MYPLLSCDDRRINYPHAMSFSLFLSLFVSSFRLFIVRSCFFLPFLSPSFSSSSFFFPKIGLAC